MTIRQYFPNSISISSGQENKWPSINALWVAKTTGTIHTLAFSPNGKCIVSGSGDKTLRIWDAATGQQVGIPLEGHTQEVNGIAYSPDEKHIVSGSNDKTLRIWGAASGEQVGVALEGHTNWVRAVAYSPDGRHIVSGSDDKTLRIWDAATGSQVGCSTGRTYRSGLCCCFLN